MSERKLPFIKPVDTELADLLNSLDRKSPQSENDLASDLRISLRDVQTIIVRAIQDKPFVISRGAKFVPGGKRWELTWAGKRALQIMNLRLIKGI